MKWHTRGIIVIAAAAVIASSQLPAWQLTSNDAPIAAAKLDNQTPSLRYLVHAELQGPGPFEGLDGWVAARLDVSPSQPTSIATVEIRSLTHPEVTPTNSMVPATVTHHDVYMDAWLACTSDPCAEDFEITISRDPLLDLPPLDVTGFIQAGANGPAEVKEPPQNSQIVVTVMGPL